MSHSWKSVAEWMAKLVLIRIRIIAESFHNSCSRIECLLAEVHNWQKDSNFPSFPLRSLAPEVMTLLVSNIACSPQSLVPLPGLLLHGPTSKYAMSADKMSYIIANFDGIYIYISSIEAVVRLAACNGIMDVTD